LLDFISSSPFKDKKLFFIESPQMKSWSICTKTPKPLSAGDSAYYFPNDKSSQTLANTIENWLNLYKENKHPKPDGIKYITWKENVEKLLEVLLGNYKSPGQYLL